MKKRNRLQLDLTDEERRQIEALRVMFGKTRKTDTVKAAIAICTSIMDHAQPSAGGFKGIRVQSNKDSEVISLIFI